MATKSLGVLTLDLIAKVGGFEQGMDRAARKADRRMGQIQRSANNVDKSIRNIQRAFVALGGAMAIRELSQWVTTSIDAADRANKFSQQVGVATETLTGLALGLELSGTNSETFEKGLVRLNRNLSDAGRGLSTAKDAFADLGVEFRQADGSLRNTEEVLREISDQFSEMEDGARKTARATELFGRAGAELIPFLNQGSAGLDKMIERSRALGLVWSQEDAAAAEQFNDSLTVMSAVQDGLSNQIAKEMLPTLNNLAAEFLDMAEDGDSARTAAALLSNVLKGLTTAGILVGNTFKVAGSYIGAVAAAAVQAANGEFSQAWSIIKMGAGDIADTTNENLARVNRIWSETAEQAEKNAEKIRNAAGMRSGPGGLAEAEAAKAQSDAMDELIDSSFRLVQAYQKAADADREFAQARKETLAALSETLMTEEESVLASYKRRRDIILANTEETSLARRDLLARLEQKTNDELSEINQGFWANYLDAAETALTSLDDIAATTISNFSSGVGNALESMVFDAESASDAFKGLAEGMARSIINALGQMAAQWLAYQIVQMAVGKTTATASAAAMVAQAQAASAMASLNAFSSTAAIPIVGPAAAPAAAAAAGAATAPFVATVAATSFAGMFDEGGFIPSGKWGIAGERGPEIVQGPAHVTSRADTAKMLGGGDVVVNVNNAPPGTTVNRRNEAGREIIDVLVADINDDGPIFRALQGRSNVRRVGS